LKSRFSVFILSLVFVINCIGAQPSLETRAPDSHPTAKKLAIPQLEPYGHESVDRLVSAIEYAANQKRLDLYLKCSCWERLPTKLQVRFRSTKPMFMKDTLLSVEAIPSSKNPFGEDSDFEYNINYLGTLEFNYKAYGRITVGYGTYKDRYYLATPIKKR
jgi:hypothetical protein